MLDSEEEEAEERRGSGRGQITETDRLTVNVERVKMRREGRKEGRNHVEGTGHTKPKPCLSRKRMATGV